ncbi:hypothetical protein HID58_032898, partial [Brassica napus]
LRRYTFRCGFSHSSPASLPGGEDSGAVVRRGWESGAWWLFRGFPSRHRLDLARSAFNGGRFCSGGGAPALSRLFRRQFAVVDDKCPRSRRPWTTVPVRASVASTSADRVWFRGFFALLVVVAGYQPVVYPNKSGLCSKLGCWWFQWGSLGFLEFSGACEFQEGGVEVAVLRCLVSGASTGSGSSVPPFRYGPIVVYSEFQALVGICAVAGGRTFV